MRDPRAAERAGQTGELWAELLGELGAGLQLSAAERSAWIRLSGKCLVFCLLAMMERTSTPGERGRGGQEAVTTIMTMTAKRECRLPRSQITSS